MLSFLFVDKWKPFVTKRHRSFWRHVRYILYSIVMERSFLKGSFCTFNSFMTGAQKNYNYTVIYPNLKSYTAFEREYNKLSKTKYFTLWKPIILHWKINKIHFLIIYAKHSNIKCYFAIIIIIILELKV